MVTPRKPKAPVRACRTLLQAQRLAMGLTLQQMAALIGVRPGTYTSWEYGNTWPRRAAQEMLEAALNSPLAALMAASAIALDDAGNYHVVGA